MIDARPEVPAIPPDRREGCCKRCVQFVAVFGATIGEHSFGQLPNAFVGIEFWSVAREADEMEPRDASNEFLDLSSAVRPPAVPEQEDVATQVTYEVAQKGADLVLLDVLVVQVGIEAEGVAPGADRDARDGRYPIAPVEMTNHRRLAHGRPGPCDRRGQEEARFVGKDEVGAQPSGVFFTLGQSSRTNRRISASFRSSARFCGF